MVSNLCYPAVLISWLMCVDIKPTLTRSPTKFADHYPSLIIQHVVSTQADMFLACSSPKEAELSEDETLADVDATVTTVNYELFTLFIIIFMYNASMIFRTQQAADFDENDSEEATDDL